MNIKVHELIKKPTVNQKVLEGFLKHILLIKNGL